MSLRERQLESRSLTGRQHLNRRARDSEVLACGVTTDCASDPTVTAWASGPAQVEAADVEIVISQNALRFVLWPF